MRLLIFKKTAKFAMLFIIACLFAATSHAQNVWISNHSAARNAITESTIQNHVEFLTDEICCGRATGTRGAIEAACWIGREFENYGLLKFNGSYNSRFKTEKGVLGTNVIGLMRGSVKTANNKYVIVGAHFDHLGTINGRLFPGADANASGVASLLSIARMFSSMKESGKSWTSDIIFVAFDGNSHDLAGSKAFWKMIEDGKLIDPISGERITKKMINLMVNIDQIGSSLSPLKSGRKDYMIMLGNNSIRDVNQDKIDICNKLYMTNLELSHTYYGSENFTRMFYNMSDQKVFIDNNIPAVMFTSGITMNNNKTRDKASSLNYPVLRRRIYLIYHWVERMM